MSPNAKFDPFELKFNPEVAESLANLLPYIPGKPIEETKREFGLTEVIKLASNENPLGPSPKAIEAVRAALDEMHLYPDASHFELKRALSHRLSCLPREICIGNGSNEHIDLLIRTFVAPSKNVVFPEKSFIAYKLCAQLQGCAVKEVPVDRDFSFTKEALLKCVDVDTRLVFLANPNNPTGNFIDGDTLASIANDLNDRHVLLVLDYAYWEYVTEKSVPDPVAFLHKHPNVIVLRTFSKIYGLAGFRVGYALAHPKVVQLIEKARQPFNVSAAALVAARAALDDEAFVRQSVENNEAQKKALAEFFKKFQDVRFFPSQGNFVLIDVGQVAQPLYQGLLERGVIVRPVANYGLPNHLRISVGLPAENEKFFQAFEAVWKLRGARQ